MLKQPQNLYNFSDLYLYYVCIINNYLRFVLKFVVKICLSPMHYGPGLTPPFSRFFILLYGGLLVRGLLFYLDSVLVKKPGVRLLIPTDAYVF